MTDPLTTVMPRRRPITYAARPGFTPISDGATEPQPTQEPTPGRPSPRTQVAPAAAEPTDDYATNSHADESDDQALAGPADLDLDSMDILEAGIIEFLYPPTEDPFDVSVVLGAAGVAVGTRLTPAVLNDLIEQLHCVRNEQRQAMGLLPLTAESETVTAAAVEHSRADHPEADDDTINQEGIPRRAADPLGLRHLRSRSPRFTVLIGGGIAVLLVLSVLWTHFIR